MKQLAILLVVSILFIGCGETVESKDDKTKYDFWEYRTPQYDLNKTFNTVVYDNDTITNYLLETTQVAENVIDTSTLEITFKDQDPYNILKYSNYIDNGFVNEQRFIYLNDEVRDDCIFYKHFDSYNPLGNYIYKDVIQLKCGDTYINYQKNIGNIGNYNIDNNITTLTFYNSISKKF